MKSIEFYEIVTVVIFYSILLSAKNSKFLKSLFT